MVSKQEKCTIEASSFQSVLKESTSVLYTCLSNNATESSSEIPKGAKMVSKQEKCPIEVSSSQSILKGSSVVLNTCLSNNSTESSSETPKVRKVTELSDLEFEARSSKDGAWYDVDAFVAHRVHTSGELEVRVRFVGYGAEDDEWMTVKKNVRERSLPLEPSECRMVGVGDLVLCFRERTNEASYFDAHVLEVKRRVHDIRGCRCLFLVRYIHDHVEERVNLRKICCRPSY